MSRVPSYPFRVIVAVKLGESLRTETHNYQNLASALAYRTIALGKRLTKRVEVVMVIDESTPGHTD